jgi:hypothetical protein
LKKYRKIKENSQIKDSKNPFREHPGSRMEIIPFRVTNFTELSTDYSHGSVT